MECNKEEAIRAKEIAEQKMESKDFASARKIALKAQHLFPDLKDISQMILVCDVHCAAQNKVYGNESDWYGILQVDPTADEAVIKKQYRKLALSLHPDKNKLAGSSDAFKLIGEAHNVLSDRQKRTLFDSRYKAAGKYQLSNRASQQGNRQSNSREHPWFQNNFMNNATAQFMNKKHQQQKPQTQSGPDKNRPTFWTSCPFCSVRYQYYREVLNKTLVCQGCKKSFTGYEMNAPIGTSGTNSSQTTFSQQRGSVSHSHSTAVPQSSSKRPSSKTANQGSIKSEDLTRNSFPEKIFTSESDKDSMHQNSYANTDRFSKFRDSKKNSKKRNKSAESSDSCDSESTTDPGEDVNVEEDGDNLLRQNFGYYSQQNLRRSTRSKQKVSYDENLSGDDELAKPSKRSKSCESSCGGAGEVEGHSAQKHAGPAADILENDKEVNQSKFSSSEENLKNGEKETETAYEKVSASMDNKRNSTPEVYEYPDPDFSDFDEVKKKECFAPGQIWAAYDTFDAMPRFYVLIRKVFQCDFELQITWLEPDPDDEDQIKWVSKGLPASCGKFRRGNSENSGDHAMFSHPVIWEKGGGRTIYKIYPRKGETWAIFKDWDRNWEPDPEGKRKYEFEFVEVLSDYADNVGVVVAYLCKLKGFACLFCRTMKAGRDAVLIPAKELFRFSHRVPSSQMTGKEGKNVPPGSFELDPASLPTSHNGIDVFENLYMDAEKVASCSKSPFVVLDPKDDSRKNASQTEFLELNANSKGNDVVADLVEPRAKCIGNDSLAGNIKLEGHASQAHSAEPKAELVQNATVANVTEPVTIENESSADEVDQKAKSEGDSYPRQGGKKDCQNSTPNACESFPIDIVESPTSASEAFAVPDPEFYNFDTEKSLEKFQVGQIWAIYSDEDALPKYYGMIKRIEPHPNFGLYLTWLAGCSSSKDMILWSNKNMPIGCGKFKVGRGKPQRYETTGAFSHQLRVQSPDEKHVYSILPQNGDVWALYKNWSSGMRCSDLETCDYEIVEVVEKNEIKIRVLVLERVHGFKSVFKPQTGEQSSVTMQIPLTQLLRFSHQIPAFRLTEEKEGTLRGFWELDPAALPVYFFCLS